MGRPEEITPDEKRGEAVQVEDVNRLHLTASQEADTAGEGEPTMTRAKWLACIALGLGYTTQFQQGACTGAILKSIDEELGPTTYYNWMLGANTIATAVALPLAGGISDIIGRRWFLISGGLLGIIAGIIAVSAQSVPQIIASSVVAGMGGGAQQLAWVARVPAVSGIAHILSLAAVGELVPNKHRGKVQACLDLAVLPWSIFGTLTGGAMVTYHTLSFRINFIIGIILNSISCLMAYYFYFPPSRTHKLIERGTTKSKALASLDWIGVAFLCIGLTLFLAGVALGGATYPWKHPGWIVPTIIGFLSLVSLGLWEWKGAKQPFMAKELFVGKSRTFVLFLCVDFVAGMALYASAAFWAQLCRGIWQVTPLKVGVLSIPGGFGGAIGGFIAGMVIGRYKYFSTRLCLIYGTILKVVADVMLMQLKPGTIPLGLGTGFISMFSTGWTSVCLIVCVQLACQDEDIGLATLMLGSVRATGGSVAVAVYSSLLTNTMKADAGPRVARAVLKMGLPISSLRDLVVLLINEDTELAGQLEGVTPEILQAARDALAWSWTLAFHRVYIAATAFASCACVAALLTKDVSKGMTNHVAVRLENEREKAKEEAAA